MVVTPIFYAHFYCAWTLGTEPKQRTTPNAWITFIPLGIYNSIAWQSKMRPTQSKLSTKNNSLASLDILKLGHFGMCGNKAVNTQNNWTQEKEAIHEHSKACCRSNPATSTITAITMLLEHIQHIHFTMKPTIKWIGTIPCTRVPRSFRIISF